MKYLYLHGFASSPNSYKARQIQKCFAELGLAVDIPDLNLTDFGTVTLSDQLDFLERNYFADGQPITVIGSSLGGFLAVQLAARNVVVEKLVLFAPAFGFGKRIAEAIGAENIAQWQQDGVRQFYHYGLQRNVNLHFQFLIDAQNYSEDQLTRSLPTLIFHGIDDDVVPVGLSQEFAQRRSQVTLHILEDDHALGKDFELIWRHTRQFLNL